MTDERPVAVPGVGTDASGLRAVAQGFGADARRYHRARPDYPAALFERIAASLPGAERSVIDVGIGTGIAATLLRDAGCQVLGVEPDERMAALAREAGFPVEVARIEDWDPAGRAFGGMTAAQAWHWVDPAAGAAKAASALVPGGLLALFWNSFMPPAEVNAAIGAVYARVLARAAPGAPAMGSGLPGPEGYRQLCDKAAGAITATGSFGQPEHWRFDWSRDYTTAQWLDAVQTFGGWGRIPAGGQREILDGIGEAIDGAGGSFTMGYATVGVAAARSPATEHRLA
jgi:SAM-dependent methyltransferase